MVIFPRRIRCDIHLLGLFFRQFDVPNHLNKSKNYFWNIIFAYWGPKTPMLKDSICNFLTALFDEFFHGNNSTRDVLKKFVKLNGWEIRQ